MSNRWSLGSAFFGAALACAPFLAPLPTSPAGQEPPDELESAFQALVDADHWRKRNAARDRLIALGPAAFETALSGTRHASDQVRVACYEILREHFPTDERSIDAILAGLHDEDVWHIAYPCAFHLGQHRIQRARPALLALLEDDSIDELETYAAAKSLGELGDAEMTVILWQGLGSDHAYTRYLSNLGMKGLCGKDLADFGYQGPWEGAFVSGPAVGTTQGQPIEKARTHVQRWQAIVELGEWLRGERPELFAELEQKLW